MSAERPEYDLEAWRRRIPALDGAAPPVLLSNCSHSPMCDATRDALDRYRDSWDRDVMDWDAWMVEVDGAKAAFARLIGAHPDEVALVPRMGAASRRIETPSVAAALRAHLPVETLDAPPNATLDGGDVLNVDGTLYVGLSRRTNHAALKALAHQVLPHGHTDAR